MNYNFFKFTFLLAGFALLMTSCDPDLVGPITGDGDPTVSVSGAPGVAIDAGTSFSITASATPTDANLLKSLDITESNQLVDFSRITVNGSAATANPILLFGDDKNGFTWTIDIVSHDDEATREYSVNVIDDGNNESNFGFDVTTMLNVVNPSLDVTSSMDIEVDPSSLIGINMKLIMGTYDLASLGVYQNEVLIDDLSRLYYADLSTNFNGNPHLLPDGDKDGAEITLYLKVQDTPGNEAYRIVLTDVEGNSVPFEFNVITATPVSEITGVLFNAAGPAGTGGLDLDEGVGTGSSSVLAEIKDEGINTDLPVASNWRKSISSVNGSIIRSLKAGENGLSETFTYEDVTAKETVAAIFENGSALTLTNAGGDLISASINEGDMFSIQNGDKTYLIIIRQVNETAADNGDNYVIDIKS